MKKLIIIVMLLITAILSCGCGKKETPKPAEFGHTWTETILTENIIEETILWENVETETWD